MSDIIIYHNGECSKCRGALEILQEKGIPHVARWYLAEPLTGAELSELLGKLKMKPSELVRTSEPLYTQYEGKNFTEDQWLDILVEHPHPHTASHHRKRRPRHHSPAARKDF